MNKEKTIDIKLIGFTSVALLLGVAFAAAVGVSADAGAANGWQGERGDCDAERHAMVEEAIAGGYDEWAELAESFDRRGRITEVVTADNFDTFVAMHEAMEAGDTEEAQEQRAKLGLGMHRQDGSGYRGGNGEGKGLRDGNMHRGMGSGDGTNNRWGN